MQGLDIVEVAGGVGDEEQVEGLPGVSINSKNGVFCKGHI